MVNARSAPPVPLLELASEDGTPVYRLHGAWRLAHLEAAGAALPSSPPAAACIVDGSALESIDTAGGFLLWRHLAGRAQGTSGITLRAMAPPHARLLRLVNDATTLRFDVLAENDARGVERGQCDAIILGHYAGNNPLHRQPGSPPAGGALRARSLAPSPQEAKSTPRGSTETEGHLESDPRYPRDARVDPVSLPLELPVGNDRWWPAVRIGHSRLLGISEKRRGQLRPDNYLR